MVKQINKRLQFRVWDINKNKILYDNFVIRDGNPISKELWSRLSNGRLGEPYPYTNGEGGNQGAEPLENPKSVEVNNYITQIQEPGNIGGASWSLIDWSNFYGLDSYIVMQSTGFHDITGHIIFEGDILEKDGIVAQVQWYYGCYIWNGVMLAEYDNAFQGERLGNNSVEFKLVGNIYEQQNVNA